MSSLQFNPRKYAKSTPRPFSPPALIDRSQKFSVNWFRCTGLAGGVMHNFRWPILIHIWVEERPLFHWAQLYFVVTKQLFPFVTHCLKIIQEGLTFFKGREPSLFTFWIRFARDIVNETLWMIFKHCDAVQSQWTANWQFEVKNLDREPDKREALELSRNVQKMSIEKFIFAYIHTIVQTFRTLWLNRSFLRGLTRERESSVA